MRHDHPFQPAIIAIAARHVRPLQPQPYDRARDLPRLLPLWPEDLADHSVGGRERLVRRLRSVLRRERQRGLAGDWSYDLARHRQLVIAHRAEVRALRWAVMRHPST